MLLQLCFCCISGQNKTLEECPLRSALFHQHKLSYPQCSVAVIDSSVNVFPPAKRTRPFAPRIRTRDTFWTFITSGVIKHSAFSDKAAVSIKCEKWLCQKTELTKEEKTQDVNRFWWRLLMLYLMEVIEDKKAGLWSLVWPLLNNEQLHNQTFVVVWCASGERKNSLSCFTELH